MEKRRREDHLTTSKGYSAMIAVDTSEWETALGVRSKVTMQQQGWMTALEIGIMLHVHRTTARDKMEAAVAAGTAERIVCNLDGRSTVLYRLKR